MSVTVSGSNGSVTVYGGGARVRGFSLAIDVAQSAALAALLMQQIARPVSIAGTITLSDGTKVTFQDVADLRPTEVVFNFGS